MAVYDATMMGFFCLPGCGILSPLSTDSTPWFSRLLNGLPQLIQESRESQTHSEDTLKSLLIIPSHQLTGVAPVLTAQTEIETHFHTIRHRCI